MFKKQPPAATTADVRRVRFALWYYVESAPLAEREVRARWLSHLLHAASLTDADLSTKLQLPTHSELNQLIDRALQSPISSAMQNALAETATLAGLSAPQWQHQPVNLQLAPALLNQLHVFAKHIPAADTPLASWSVLSDLLMRFRLWLRVCYANAVESARHFDGGVAQTALQQSYLVSLRRVDVSS